MIVDSSVGAYEFFAANVLACLTRCESGLRHYLTPECQAYPVALVGTDLGMYLYAQAVLSENHLGRPQRALELREEGLKRAEASGNPYSLGVSLAYAQNLSRERRDYRGDDCARDASDRALDRAVAVAETSAPVWWREAGPVRVAATWRESTRSDME